MIVQEYLENINRRFKTGISREHSYRGDLQTLLESLATGALATNEPARIRCGAPDFILTRRDIPVGYIEAKDIGKDLTSKDFKEQFDRYRKSLNNLIFTDYLDFRLYVDGDFVTEIKIAEIQNGAIKFLPEHYERFADLIKDFSAHRGQTITSPKKLAEMMAGKAKMLAQVIEQALESDEETNQNSTLKEQMKAFLDVLIHDITPKEFADIYAQTIAYGMFAARLHDPDLDTFSRQEAAELIPKSNPFLRKLFQHIAGYDLDTRIKWIVDALADIFRATDVAALLENFGTATETRDPIIHFYETFLAAYDPKLRKSRGVYYTPEPVVDFIVRAVDDVLKTEFNLPDGLADTSKTMVTLDTQTVDKRSASGYKQIEKEVHRVQILDPATGTGTFLAAVVKHIYRQFEGQRGIWSSYVENHLVPRLNGFELLMASYTVAHLKLDMLLTETGYKPSKDRRFKIYLTNSLEEHHPDTGMLWTGWLSREANEANYIKRDTPVMCVIGNPPYSISSSNKSGWIEKLMVDYKKDLNERNINPLSDDYLKFIRFGQHFIEKNGEGVLAYISNNSFLDGIIHKQVRKNLLESFDKIFILNLHGSSKKEENSPDGSTDQNVFDIMQGVSINIFVKLGKTSIKSNAKLYHYDLFGKREIKYQALANNSLNSISWNIINPPKPDYFFVPKNYDVEEEYNSGLKVSDLFQLQTSGIKTHRDGLVVNFNEKQLSERITDFYDKEISNSAFIAQYNLDEKETWLNEKRLGNFAKDKIKKISFRPFDNRFIYYSNDLIDRSREKVMQHILAKENIVALFPRQAITEKFGYFITKEITDINFTGTAGQFGAGLAFPLYLYPETGAQQTLHQTAERTPNLNAEIVGKIAEKIGLTFVYEKEITPSLRATPPKTGGEFEEKLELETNSSPPLEGGEFRKSFAPIDVLDYIYAVLHSPDYRKKYKEFLKIDFPRVPFPKDAATFWQLVNLGGELRQVHLLDAPAVSRFATTYPNSGDNIVTRKMTTASIGFELTDAENQTGKVWINDEQYFDKVPLVAWEFYIGGYQPAQKWLKDRAGRELSFEDIAHYQKIIAALSETERLMKQIDRIDFE